MARTDDELEDDEIEDRAADGEDDEDEDDGASTDPLEAYFDNVDERVEQLVSGSLKPTLEALEAERVKVFSFVTRGFKLAIVPFILWVTGDLFRALLSNTLPPNPVVDFIVVYWNIFVIAIAVAVVAYIVKALVMPGIAAALNFRRRFKEQIVSAVFPTFVPDGTYSANHHVSKQVFEESGLYSGAFSMFKGDDLIRGRVGGVEFEASEIQMANNMTIRSGKQTNRESSRPNVTLFHGLFYHFATPKSVRGHIILEPDNAEGRFFKHRSGLEQVDVVPNDDPFAEEYRVYATDANEAREILTPHIRTRLLKIAEQMGRPPFISFIKNKVFVAAHEGRDAIEPNVSKANSYGTIFTVAEFFAWPALLVRELGLASTSWSAAGAPSGSMAGSLAGSIPGSDHLASTHTFAQPTFTGVASGGSILSQPAARANLPDLKDDIGAKDLTTLALQAPEDQVSDEDLARRPPPESRVKVSPMTGEGLDVTYGIHAGFWVRILWTLGLAPFAIAGLARLAGPSGESVLQAVTAQLPIAAQVGDLAVEHPIIFSVVVFLFWLWPAWRTLHVPSGTHITREGVRVSKRLWPIAKRYALDQIENVQVNESQVVLIRRNSGLLRRFISPSPRMPSKDDARWLAAHMRRALLMFGGLKKKA